MVAPAISVILPVYNCEPYITECIASVLNQSFRDFELLVFNDGSTDRTLDKINAFSDHRIVLVDSKENKGYVKLLNDGIIQAKGKYIVRMDADDVCLTQRFETLYNYMEANPEVGVCGSFVEVFGNVKKYIWRLPEKSEHIKAVLPFRIPFVHPSVIIRKCVLYNNHITYKHAFLPAEDYEMWCQLAGKTRFANVPQVLLRYRQHGGQISKEKRAIQRVNSDKVRELYWKNLFPIQEDFLLYQQIVNEELECSLDFFEHCTALFKRIEKVNEISQLIDTAALHRELSYQLFKVATHLSSHKVKTYTSLRKSGFLDFMDVNCPLYFKYVLKNFLY